MKRLFLISILALQTASAAAENKKLCVYDPSGQNGDAFNIAKEYKAAALGWGVDFTLKPYTDEKTAADDFKAGQCEAVLMTGLRVRGFNKFAGTIEAMGAIPDYAQLGQIISQLASPKAGALLTQGDYRVVSIIPAGSVYLLVSDRTVDSVGKLAGKRIATLDYDDAAKAMVRQVGASMVAADIGTFAGMFNNGGVDACYAPAVAFKALELQKGVAKNGGVVKYVLSQLTFQVLTKTSAFTEAFSQESRKWASDSFDKFRKTAERADASIPKEKWLNVSDAQRVEYDKVFQEVRVKLRDESKVFDKGMLTLMRRVRCKVDAARAECSTQRE